LIDILGGSLEVKVHIWERKVMWGDLDPLGIVFYPRYYEWMDASSHLFFEALGIPLGEILRARRIVFGLAATSCRYISPARYHERIQIRTSLKEVGSKTLELGHAISTVSEGRLVAEGSERRICVEVLEGGGLRAIAIPDDLMEILRGALE
jgi:4-hydroxybenzoyl-CoA thioesterase